MKIVVIGGTGLIGSKVVDRLRKHGHDVLAASPSSGVNTLTGEGLGPALDGATVVIDVANSPAFDDEAAMSFFSTSGRNLLAAEGMAGVRHHLALSVVGTERLQESGYFRAKQRQEDLIRQSGIPYTIVHSTQFFEFISGIIKSADDGTNLIRLPAALIQPIAADDVASAVSEFAEAAPVNATVEIAGPDAFPMDEMAREYLTAVNDRRDVVADPKTRYYGALLSERTLTPGDHPRLAQTSFTEWLGQRLAAAV